MFGFANEYRIDLGDSVYYYQDKSYDYEPNNCYVNSFHCLFNNMKNGGFKKNKAVFGYVLSTDGIRKVAVRHAWNEIGNSKVDITIIANGENLVSASNYSYLPTAEYTATEFLNKIEKNNGFADLPVSEAEKKCIDELKIKGFEVLGL